MIELLHGDCLDLMKGISDKSIDMILCDLPYGTTACKWDIIIPFEPLWEQYKRIIKDKGCIALFGSEPFSSYLRMSNIKNYKYDWIWNKKVGSNFASVNNQPLKIHETVSIFNSRIYYPIKTFDTKKPFGKIVETEKTGVAPKTKKNKREQGYPKSILIFPRVNNLVDGYFGHNSQKPIAILEYLIKTYTLGGETILDNCMGSGSTGVACINTNRNFIGIEKDDKYFEIAKNRIEQAQHDVAPKV